MYASALGLRDNRYARLAFMASLAGHLAFVYMMLFKPFVSDKLPSVIYSVTMETGATKGGVTQIPDPKNQSDVVPMKKVSQEEEQKPEVKPQEKEPEKEVETKPEEKAEVIIPDDKKEKVEPKKPEKEVKKPEVKATPKPKAAPPTKKPTKPVKKEVLPDSNQNYQKALQRYLGASTAAGGTGFGAAGGVGKGMGGGVLKSPEWFRYKARLEAHVKQGWNWHDPKVELLATVRFSISPTGALSNVRLVQSSGNPSYDEAALRSVSRSSPVPAATKDIYPDFADVVVDFTP